MIDRSKKPPPLPKFQEKKNQQQLEQKLNSFMSSLNSNPVPNKGEQISQPQKEVKGKADETKKKISLANINSKLNNMLNAKKININTALAGDIDKEKQEKQQKIKPSDIDYDPQFPNNYELGKLQYLAKLERQKQQQEMSDQDTMLQKIEQTEEIKEQNQSQEMVAEEKEQIALRMMQKFGYKIGEGLGKQGQGIKTPLIVKKTNQSTGVIEQSSIPLNYLISPEISAKNAINAHNIEMSRVVVITGAAHKQQIEEGVAQQIKEQCAKFGTINEFITYLQGQQIRFFVKFQTKEEAFKTFVSINGKYFGEKMVSVKFYCQESFQNRQFTKPLHQHIPT